jgi:hypothetical protein
MSKITELRIKYPKITEMTFNKLVAGDPTPTKKYSEFLLSAWSKKTTKYGGLKSADEYIKLVKRFDEHLPFIEVKDIYQYDTIDDLISTVKVAEVTKFEKGFVREQHITVISETDEYLFLIPKTHAGSLKYGSNTKWCTSSRGSESNFKSYSERGFLIYLIDKTNSKTNNVNKVALYFNSRENLLTQPITIYNQIDVTISEKVLINGGWSIVLLGELFGKLRDYLFEYREKEQIRLDVSKTIQQLNQINYDNFFKALGELRVSPEKITDLRDALGLVKTSIKKLGV